MTALVFIVFFQQAFRHIQKTCMDILKAVEIYQNRIFGKLLGAVLEKTVFSMIMMMMK